MNDIDLLDIRKILEHAHIGVVIHRADTSIVYANPAALHLLKLEYGQIIGTDAFDPRWCFVDENGRPLEVDEYPVNKVKNTRCRLENELMGVMNGSEADIVWFQVNAYMEGRREDQNSFIVVTFSDVTERVKPFSAEAIVENAQDMIIVTEADNIDYPHGPKIVYVNQSFEQITGYTKDEVIGETPRILQGSLTSEAARNRIRLALVNKTAVSETLLNYDKHGRPYWIEMNIIPLHNRKGEVTHFAAIERDISKVRFQQEQLENRNRDLKAFKISLEAKVKERTLSLQRATEKLQKLAYFDPLTQMPNRRFFSMQLEKQIKSAARRDEFIAFGLIDLDDFKHINDDYGHKAGDEVLQAVAKELSSSLRGDDTLCRYGGEEFVISLSIADADEVVHTYQRVMRGIRSTKIRIGKKTVVVTASVGVIVVSSQSQPSEATLYRQADALMYAAKSAGKDRCYIECDGKRIAEVLPPN